MGLGGCINQSMLVAATNAVNSLRLVVRVASSPSTNTSTPNHKSNHQLQEQSQ